MAPPTVMLADPDDAQFTLATALTTPFPTDSPPLTLPTLPCTDSEIQRLPLTPLPAWQRTDVSDSHELCSHRLHPLQAEALRDRSPMLDPCTVTLLDPVAAVLAPLTALLAFHDAEIPRLELPARLPTVKNARRLPITP